MEHFYGTHFCFKSAPRSAFGKLIEASMRSIVSSEMYPMFITKYMYVK